VVDSKVARNLKIYIKIQAGDLKGLYTNNKYDKVDHPIKKILSDSKYPGDVIQNSKRMTMSTHYLIYLI